MSAPYENWLSLGERLGYTGEKLETFIAKKEQEFLDREERARKREEEREAREAEIDVKRQEIEAKRQEQEAKRRERETHLELQRRKEEHALELERLQIEGRLQAEQQERELSLRQKELELAQLRSEVGAPLDVSMRQDSLRGNRPKLPKFDEAKDDIDAFIERFERFAASQEWPEDTWAASLSALLTGKGLDVYASMPPEQTNDYDALKKAVLHRYQLTADGFKNKFREAKPDRGETVFQFVARLKRYLDRWTELAEANGSVAAIKDLFIR